MAAPYQGPLPVRQPESDFYWEKTKKHELWLRKCMDCKDAYFYPRDFCPKCGNRNVTWIHASGKGTLHTFAIVERAPVPALGDKVPFIVAMVDLEEGPRFPTNIVGVDANPENLSIGMELEVTFLELTEEITLPLFKPV
tara:strand:- start:938 stop:1354 length:417 start_codon:yes stop_codon:yes gene_type:complete